MKNSLKFVETDCLNRTYFKSETPLKCLITLLLSSEQLHKSSKRV